MEACWFCTEDIWKQSAGSLSRVAIISEGPAQMLKCGTVPRLLSLIAHDQSSFGSSSWRLQACNATDTSAPFFNWHIQIVAVSKSDLSLLSHERTRSALFFGYCIACLDKLVLCASPHLGRYRARQRLCHCCTCRNTIHVLCHTVLPVLVISASYMKQPSSNSSACGHLMSMITVNLLDTYL